MKVAVFGASGWIGQHLVEEAKARGHQVVAIVRDPAKVTRQDVEVRQCDLQQETDLSSVLEGVDAVIASIGGRNTGNHNVVAQTAQLMLAQLPRLGINRLLWVGGAGSLEVSSGVSLLSLPEFPEEYKAEAQAQSEALDVFRNSPSTLNWTFVSPAAEIFPGGKQAAYRVGGDQLLVDEEQNSRISVSDYAVAMIDMLETESFTQQRVGIAY
ncbi:NAD(P)-dependent oxidoreductase [Vibrio cincinnatiensis]|uniref:NAD(P)-binding domain-containing protein n=1 Tax=Vibrio cincinnatiensis DSM 19608 TaxID=1123491 RepID=A0A1T4Q025_VIBCI|nr:NAD(P)-dependent oxidoreductase [Vibrio cincinnatiensis]MCG3721015.1 NAD(P)-dependent oxidoreductase [Vibrio cincinnatiensis]SJZ96926.1 hypothetical protein SAMN02745782_01924 [Vibrio cincinnatiensis DSM 19608]SUP05264.1 Rrf2-linked NADH-flavin reductase [Vibrio cincinnatiensis]